MKNKLYDMNLSNLKPAEGSTKTRKRAEKAVKAGEDAQMLLKIVQVVSFHDTGGHIAVLDAYSGQPDSKVF